MRTGDADLTESVLQRRAADGDAAAAERRNRAARDVVADLQEALLPTALPVLPSVKVAGRYLVAAQEQSAGGDWFDALPFRDGRLALVVGDIVGHGVAASAAMGQLRAVVGEVLIETGSLEQALRWADRMASRSPMMRAATICAAVLDPLTGELRYSTCGHPPPLLIGADGATRFLPPSGTGPLGTGSTPRITEGTVATDEVLVLYSDGLIERPGQPLTTGMQRLAQVAGNAAVNRVMPVTAAPSAAERICQHSVELLTREGCDDDATVLAAQRLGSPTEPLHRDLPAEPEAFAEASADLLGWLDRIGPDPHDRAGLELAVTELVANVLEHAYPPGGAGGLRLSAALGTDGVVQLEVADEGAWREPETTPPTTRGRGLWMTDAVVDELTVDHVGSAGTVVTVRQRLHHPATLAGGHAAGVQQAGRDEYSARLEEGPPRTLRVSGPVDAGTAARFADRIAVASRGGTYQIVIDLAAVDLLSSAGVSVLLAARDEQRAHGHELHITAVPNSIPAQVLSLVGLDHSSGPPYP